MRDGGSPADDLDRSLLVLCAANNFDDVRLSDRPLAEALANSRQVLYVDPPLSHLSPRNNPRLAVSLESPRLRQVDERLWRLTPVVTPLPLRRGVVGLTRHLTRRSLARALRRLELPVSAVVSTWLDIDVFDLCSEARHAYWVQDDVASGAALWGLDVERITRAERRVSEAADVVLTASPLAAEQWRARVERVEVLPNGCDPDRFARARTPIIPPVLPVGQPVAGFVGHLNARCDLDLLRAVADRGVTVLLVGPVSGAEDEIADLLSHPGVVHVGAQPFEDMPSWLDLVGVGLLPYGTDDFNLQSFPLKTLEYLAAGLPVVSTDLPASRWLQTSDVIVCEDADQFAERAAFWAGTPRDRSAEQRRRSFAAGHSWASRAAALTALLDG